MPHIFFFFFSKTLDLKPFFTNFDRKMIKYFYFLSLLLYNIKNFASFFDHQMVCPNKYLFNNLLFFPFLRQMLQAVGRSFTRNSTLHQKVPTLVYRKWRKFNRWLICLMIKNKLKFGMISLTCVFLLFGWAVNRLY